MTMTFSYINFKICYQSVQLFSRVWLCNPMDCSMPGFPVHHQLLEFTQTYVHWVIDAIQPSYPLSSPSPPIFNLSQHQGLIGMSHLFASGGQLIRASASASVLSKNIQGWFPLEFSGLISLLFKGLSRVKYSLYHRIQWSHSYIFTQFIENLCPYKILHRALLITTKIYK